MTASNSATVGAVTILGLAIAALSVSLVTNTIVPSIVGSNIDKEAALDQVAGDINQTCGDLNQKTGTLIIEGYQVVDQAPQKIAIETNSGEIENEQADISPVECTVRNEFSISEGQYTVNSVNNGVEVETG
ncbi:hypothetical protein GLU60_01100 [Nanohaloarchaea archaeon H01]|nr:hypothetical protein [Nanohaloarchaea archaeon H01]